jgi:hypothetical protein
MSAAAWRCLKALVPPPIAPSFIAVLASIGCRSRVGDEAAI